MKSHDIDTERDEREWEAQESAVREERGGARKGSRAARSSADVGIYRLVVRALKQPRLDPLPGDFAMRTAARVEAEGTATDRVEVWLERGLVALLMLVGAAVVSSYNVESLSFDVESLRALLATVPLPAVAVPPYAVWGLAIASCVALTWLLESWQKWERPL